MSAWAKKRPDVEKAYELQSKAALRGGIRGTAIGVAVLGTAHVFWPRFRGHTLAIKGFLLTGFGIFGMVIDAENALMAHEREMRATESAIRKEARLDLARRGLVGTETEIAKWKAERQQRVADAAVATAGEATAAV